MRVILELITGPYAGRKTWLQTGQTLQVGNTEDADFAVADDPEMSALHFAVRVDRNGCQLSDLRSERGTYVNGQSVQSAALSDGDEITAGHSVLRVRIDGVRPGEEVVASQPTIRHAGAKVEVAPVRPATPVRVTSPPSRPAPAAADHQRIPYTAQSCGSGLSLLAGVDPAEDPVRVVRRLGRAAALYAVLDVRKVDVTLPSDVAAPLYLLEWLPELSQPMISPVVLRPGETQELPAVVAGAWGKDGLVCFLTGMDPAEAVLRLRRAARFNPTTGIEQKDETALSFWWPDVMRLVLTHTPAANVQYLIEGFEAVLLEGPGGQGWQLFATPDFAGRVDALGFELVEPPAPQNEPKADE
ncbi:MAG: FHA domain-containing protein [Pirellulales bacterium]|nr:FHA domain-containing protein [Pirellulales bacterium]